MLKRIDEWLTTQVLRLPLWVQPNHITSVRILLIPLVWALHYKASSWWAAGMFAFLALTDFIDGRLARGRGLVTNAGKVLDIGCDLALVWSTVALLWQENIVMLQQDSLLFWLLVFIFSREVLVTTIRLRFEVSADSVRVLKMGKCKTGFFMVSLAVFLSSPAWAAGVPAGILILGVAAICSFISGVQYVHQFITAASTRRVVD
jgi:CDP-diacylglycerol--glycerol-3-phosphate 3-phosphatidyltransferase